ncbi:hypothetical protein VIBNIFTn2_120034 [Vibrio nigripulchritudo FTn2]|uniref:hypothetical protein n=1 Tax=Vibrio nigripulchritudo TaxID=28173 RepID=UPI0003B2239F|nr:hypothetical protein [Vibrio nigripulchritudo]CCN40052.1 hypothetical protein VIBNIFTn2_120034 [Vibrio nigripulchritudo FTn2]
MFYSKARLEHAGRNWLATDSSSNGHGCQFLLSKSEIVNCLSGEITNSLPDFLAFRHGTGSFDCSVALVIGYDLSPTELKPRLDEITYGEYRYLFIHESSFSNSILTDINKQWGIVVCKRDSKFTVLRGAVDQDSFGFNERKFSQFRHSHDYHAESSVLLSFIASNAYHEQVRTIATLNKTVADQNTLIAQLKSERDKLRKTVRESKHSRLASELSIDVPKFLT